MGPLVPSVSDFGMTLPMGLKARADSSSLHSFVACATELYYTELYCFCLLESITTQTTTPPGSPTNTSRMVSAEVI